MSNQRRQKINVLLNDTEKQIILEKAMKYGYGNCLAEYIRDACIYESIYIESIEEKQQLYKAIDKYIQEIRKCLNTLNSLNKNISLQQEDIKVILKQIKKINNNINNLIKESISKLSVKVKRKEQIRMGFVEKNKTNYTFIDSLLNKKVSLFQPSTLNYKNYKKGTVLIQLSTCRSYVLDNINYDNLKSKIDELREIALREDAYIYSSINDNSLFLYIAKYFNDYDKAIEKQKEDKSNTMIYNFEKEMEG